MGKSKRKGRKNKTNKEKWDSLVDSTARTCVSTEKLNKSCTLSPIRVTEILSNISTPSPKLNTSSSEPKLLKVPQVLRKRRSLSSVARINTSHIEISITEYTKSPKRTPTKQIKNSPLRKNIQPETKLNRGEEFNNNIEDLSFFTPDLFTKITTPKKKISSLTSSTPKLQTKTPDLQFDENNSVFEVSKSPKGKSLKFVRSLSSTEGEIIVKTPPKVHKVYTSTSKNIYVNNAPTFCTRFSKVNTRLPCIVADIFTWIGIAIKKSMAILKKYFYAIITRQISIPDCGNCQKFEEKYIILYAKYEEQATEISKLKEELESCKEIRQECEEIRQELKEFKKQMLSLNNKQVSSNCGSLMAPPPPPPPLPAPPPLPTMPLFQFENSIKLQPVKKTPKSVTTNNRPLITVDQLMKVRLRKINPSTPLSRKPAVPNDEILKNIRLRPSKRPHTPTNLGNSPKSCLTRILKNTDTNLRSSRRVKAQFLSYDDISREKTFRFRNGGNDSAPIV